MEGYKKLRIALIIFYALSFAFCITVTILGFTQITDKTSTPKGMKMVTDVDNPCQKSKHPFNLHRPSRFTYKEEPDAVLGCGWSGGDTAVRSIISIAATLIVCASFYLNFVKKSGWSYLFAIVSIATAIGFGFLTIKNYKSVKESSDWVSAGASGASIPSASKPVTCYGLLSLIPVLCALEAFVSGCLSVLIMMWKCNAPPPSKKSIEEQENKPLINPDDVNFVTGEAPHEPEETTSLFKPKQSKSKPAKTKTLVKGTSITGGVDFTAEQTSRYSQYDPGSTAQQSFEKPASIPKPAEEKKKQPQTIVEPTEQAIIAESKQEKTEVSTKKKAEPKPSKGKQTTKKDNVDFGNNIDFGATNQPSFLGADW